MQDVTVRTVDRSAMSAAAPTWVSLAIGLCIFGSLFAIASIIVLSLIPVYLATKSVTVSSSSVSNKLSPSFSSSWSPSGSTGSLTNGASVASQLESSLGLSSGTLSVNGATTTSGSSGKRRRQASSGSSNLPHCNGSSTNPTNLDMDISVNLKSCANKIPKSKCESDLVQKVQTAFDNAGPLTLAIQYDNGPIQQVPVQRCRKFPGAQPGISAPGQNVHL